MRLTCGVLALSVLLTGCATSGLVSNDNPAKKFVKATPQSPAVKCLCVWQAAEGFDSAGKPCRGVAGQVFFFNRDTPIPVMVEGDVRVYVFDDQGNEADQAKPLSQLDIDRQTWSGQLTNTQFGPAYRMFVPYTRPGRNQAALALRLRMTPDSGPTVFSDLSSIEMTGPKSEKPEESPTTAKVEQTLRERLGGDEPTDSSPNLRLDDAQVSTRDRTSSRILATIRTSAQ